MTTDPIQGYARTHPDSGFTGVRIDPYRDSIDVYWHGAVPGTIAELLHAATAHGVHVNVHPATHSLHDLQAAQATLTAKLSSQHVSFASIGPNLDGSGLTVSRPAVAGTGRDAVRDLSAQVTSSADVPISVTDGPVSQLQDRFADTTPFWGGDFMQASTNGVECSTGFPIFGGNGQTWMLSAYHCAAAALGATWETGDGTVIGNVTGVDPQNDAMLIATDASEHDLWGGTSLTVPNGQFATFINGGGHPTDGEVDCTSGAFSGEECGISTVATGLTIRACDESGTNCIIIMNVAEGDQQNHVSASGNGDSGGPVFTIINGGANARGTISSGDPVNAPATCNGVPGGNGRTCSWKVFFPDVIDQLTGFGTPGVGV